jgi:hypothetical protein
MDDQTKKPLGAGTPAALVKPCSINPITKRAAILRLFIARGELGLNCFEAVRLGHDYVLRSTVSDFSRDFGIHFSRKWEKVPGFNGSPVDCVRYWLTPEDALAARQMLSNCDLEHCGTGAHRKALEGHMA